MLVCFLGSPISGKSTIASNLHTRFKEAGQPVEFLWEYARAYIALKKSATPRGTRISLSDEDQLEIMKTQLRWEEVFEKSIGGIPRPGDDGVGMVISETCSLNAMLYMGRHPESNGVTPDVPNLWGTREVKDLVASFKRLDPLLFYCKPVDIKTYRDGKDPHRIHNAEEIARADQVLLRQLEPHLNLRLLPLEGSLEARLSKAHHGIMSRYQNLMKAASANEMLEKHEEQSR